MAFAVVCKSCQARFLLNDDLLRRKVAGRVVTVRCRQCHATIEVDASNVDPQTVPEDELPASPPAPPAPGLTSFQLDKDADTAALHPAGFAAMAGRAIRFDMLERLEDELEQALSAGTDAQSVLTRIVSLLGCGNDEARQILAHLGWRTVEVADAKPVWRRAKENGRRAKPAKPHESEAPVNSPFAGLAALRIR